ncbi:hypothetical protein COO60DRAFT_1488180, partial [Scenedesmus sp. NREL 46B-D3]
LLWFVVVHGLAVCFGVMPSWDEEQRTCSGHQPGMRQPQQACLMCPNGSVVCSCVKQTVIGVLVCAVAATSGVCAHSVRLLTSLLNLLDLACFGELRAPHPPCCCACSRLHCVL